MVIDLRAPIIPAKTAAGLRLGDSVFALLEEEFPLESGPRGETTFYDFGSVKVWSLDGSIHQIGVTNGYTGSLSNGVRLGMSIAEVEEAFAASVEEDDEDNLTVVGHPGWCFETEVWKGDHTVAENRHARITKMFVFKPM